MHRCIGGDVGALNQEGARPPPRKYSTANFPLYGNFPLAERIATRGHLKSRDTVPRYFSPRPPNSGISPLSMSRRRRRSAPRRAFPSFRLFHLLSPLFSIVGEIEFAGVGRETAEKEITRVKRSRVRSYIPVGGGREWEGSVSPVNNNFPSSCREFLDASHDAARS